MERSTCAAISIFGRSASRDSFATSGMVPDQRALQKSHWLLGPIRPPPEITPPAARHTPWITSRESSDRRHGGPQRRRGKTWFAIDRVNQYVRNGLCVGCRRL